MSSVTSNQALSAFRKHNVYTKPEYLAEARKPFEKFLVIDKDDKHEFCCVEMYANLLEAVEQYVTSNNSAEGEATAKLIFPPAFEFEGVTYDDGSTHDLRMENYGWVAAALFGELVLTGGRVVVEKYDIDTFTDFLSSNGKSGWSWSHIDNNSVMFVSEAEAALFAMRFATSN